jgi:hypothetical protein
MKRLKALALVQRIIAVCQGRKHIPAWQAGLAASAALVLLGTLLLLAPWPARHDAPRMPPRATLARDGDRTAEEARETAAPVVPTQVPEAETKRDGEQEAQSSALMTRESMASGEVSAQQPATATQAMQEPVPWPGTDRRTHEERLDTQAMDHLLTRLAAATKPPLPRPPRSKAARRKEPRRLPRVSATGRRTPDFVVSPQRSELAWPGSWSASRLFTPEPSHRPY